MRLLFFQSEHYKTKEQKDKIRIFLKNELQPVMDKLYNKGRNNDMHFTYGSQYFEGVSKPTKRYVTLKKN